MLECLNSYSNLIVALAALVSALFAGVIWWETRKYRQITTELKNMNHKLIEREKQNLQVTIPELIKGLVGLYVIPIWFTNLSSKPDSLLDLDVAIGGLKAMVHLDKERKHQLEMPLDEPINIDSLSSKVLYISLIETNPGTGITLNLKYKSTDNIFQEKSVHFLLDKNKDFYKVKDNIESLVFPECY